MQVSLSLTEIQQNLQALGACLTMSFLQWDQVATLRNKTVTNGANVQVLSHHLQMTVCDYKMMWPPHPFYPSLQLMQCSCLTMSFLQRNQVATLRNKTVTNGANVQVLSHHLQMTVCDYKMMWPPHPFYPSLQLMQCSCQLLLKEEGCFLDANPSLLRIHGHKLS